MSAHHMVSCLIVAVVLVAPGCIVETTDDQLHNEVLSVPLDPMGGPSDPEDSPPGSHNGFEPNCITRADVRDAFRQYAPQRLWNSNVGIDNGTLPANSLMDSVPVTCREEALKYLMRCALPRDTFAIDPNTGARYWGWLNLAPNWRTGPLVSDEQWWVTACVYQHVNGLGLHVPILLDGANSSLYPPGQNDPTFEKRDSRIWGNVFTGTGEFVPDVCYEDDLLDSCYEISVVDSRLCDSDADIDCNLNIVGPCSTACKYVPSAGGYTCGSGGFKNIGTRLKDFSMYVAMCVP